MGIQNARPLMGDKIAGAARDETAALILSAKVEGTPVYRSNGDKVGHIDSVMIDKRSGKVAYAVLRFGGFLGIGDEYYPLPWSLLTYSERLGGYELELVELRPGPRGLQLLRACPLLAVGALRKAEIGQILWLVACGCPNAV